MKNHLTITELLKILLSFSDKSVYVLTIFDKSLSIDTSYPFYFIRFVNPTLDILGQIPRTF